MTSSAEAQPTPAIKYLISHLPAIFVIETYRPIRSPRSTVVWKNSFQKIMDFWVELTNSERIKRKKLAFTISTSNLESSLAGKNVASISILQN